jgi:uncharacterized protein (DUF2336 family)
MPMRVIARRHALAMLIAPVLREQHDDDRRQAREPDENARKIPHGALPLFDAAMLEF